MAADAGHRAACLGFTGVSKVPPPNGQKAALIPAKVADRSIMVEAKIDMMSLLVAVSRVELCG